MQARWEVWWGFGWGEGCFSFFVGVEDFDGGGKCECECVCGQRITTTCVMDGGLNNVVRSSQVTMGWVSLKWVVDMIQENYMLCTYPKAKEE